MVSRIFLDTCTFQFLYDYGGYIFENNQSLIDESIEKYPEGKQDLQALHDIMQVNSAGASSFSFVLSESSLEEIRNRREEGFTRYALDIIDTWQITVAELGNEAFSGRGEQWAEKLHEDQFGYLSDEDQELLVDALRLECDCFLTVEKQLPKQADHLNRELPIEVLRPHEFWEEKLASHFENYPPWDD